MEWRTCPRHPLYEVSECGDVRRLSDSPTRKKGHRPKGYIDTDGYLAYALPDVDGIKQPVQAHTLVAEAFIGPRPSPKHEVAHENGSRVMHHFANLRWATRKENHHDMQGHGTAAKGENNGRAVLDDEKVRRVRAVSVQIKAGLQPKTAWQEMASEYGVTIAHLKLIATRQVWSHVSD